jgi:hypothetical protein
MGLARKATDREVAEVALPAGRKGEEDLLVETE